MVADQLAHANAAALMAKLLEICKIQLERSNKNHSFKNV